MVKAGSWSLDYLSNAIELERWNDTRADEDVMILVGGKEKMNTIAWGHMIHTLSPRAQNEGKDRIRRALDLEGSERRV